MTLIASAIMEATSERLAGSTSVLAGGPPEVHVGLGGTETADSLVVRWPDGRAHYVLLEVEGR